VQDFSNRVFLLSVSLIAAAGDRSGLVREPPNLSLSFQGFHS
jgi:hypothetical protein